MPRRVLIKEPVNKGFWDPWSAEEALRPPRREARGEPRKVCVICYSEIEEGTPTMQCPHCGAIGHRNCFDEWVSLKGTCPLCKRPIV